MRFVDENKTSINIFEMFSVLLVSVWEKPSEMKISYCHRNVNIFCLSRIKLQKWMYPSVNVWNDEENEENASKRWEKKQTKNMRERTVCQDIETESWHFCVTFDWLLRVMWNNSMFDGGDRSFEAVTVLHGDKHFKVSFAHRKSYRQFPFNCVSLSFTFSAVLSFRKLFLLLFCAACWFTVWHRC